MFKPDREKQIQFDELAHRYRIVVDPEHEYISVTTWLNSFFEPFNADRIIARMRASKNWAKSPYFKMTDDEIKKQWETTKVDASEKGTAIHNDIDHYNKLILDPEYAGLKINRFINMDNPSWKLYERFRAEHPEWRLVKTEWRLFDEDFKIAGTIDALFQNKQGEYILVDWKRCKKINREQSGYDYATPWPICHLLNTNFHHYALQLNIYRYIIETRYGLKISRMLIAILHPEYEFDNDRWIEIPDLQLQIGILAENRKHTFQNQPSFNKLL